MHDKTLIKYIYGLNKGKYHRSIFKHSLSPTVDLAQVWHKIPNPQNAIVGSEMPSTVYFIKIENGPYVGGVEATPNELHWLILPKHRKQGYLSRAMKEAILPHLFTSRTEQRISIDADMIGKKHFEASEKVAVSLGFEKVRFEHEVSFYTLSIEKVKIVPDMAIQYEGMTSERVDQLRKKINYFSKSLWLVNDEVRIAFGENYFSEATGNLVKELFRCQDKLKELSLNY